MLQCDAIDVAFHVRLLWHCMMTIQQGYPKVLARSFVHGLGRQFLLETPLPWHAKIYRKPVYMKTFWALLDISSFLPDIWLNLTMPLSSIQDEYYETNGCNRHILIPQFTIQDPSCFKMPILHTTAFHQTFPKFAGYVWRVRQASRTLLETKDNNLYTLCANKIAPL